MYWTIGFYSALTITVVITVIVLLFWEKIKEYLNSPEIYKEPHGYNDGYNYKPLFWLIIYIVIPWVVFCLIWMIGWALLLGFIIYASIKNNDKVKKIVQIIQDESEKEEQ